jgi:Restriction endonuclease
MTADELAQDEFAPEDSAEMTLGSVRFDGLSPTDFEEFCFDLLSEIGFINVDWRKGTPLNASPADRGRDIVAYLEREDVDDHRYMESWFVDCKHYERGVPPEALQGAITWAQAERPSTVLFIASGYFTNGAKDWIADYERSKPPFRIRVWEMPQLRRLLVNHMDIAFNHNVHTSSLRRVSDILAVESELTDKLWYGRKPGHDDPVPKDWKPEIVAGMRASQRRMEEQYGMEELHSHVESDFAWGMLSGKVSAIRWVLGEDWDMLDS